MSAADTARVPDAVLADIYRAILAPDAWQRILAILTPLLGGNASVHVRLDRVHPRESRFLVHGIDPQYLPAMARRDLSEDLIWRELLAPPGGPLFSPPRRYPPQ